MTASLTSISLSEWETLGPEDCPALAGKFLDTSPDTRSVVNRLIESNYLEIRELRNGLQIKAYSHVGKIRIGDLNITIFPKIKAASLLRLVRYAYGFHRLARISDTTPQVDNYGFEELLICQLNTEVQDLIARGLLRAYVETSERLSSPRGRIDMNQISMEIGLASPTLPCIHYPRIEDTLLNQVLLAGLGLAAAMPINVGLRRESRRLAALMKEQVSAVGLNGVILNQVAREQNRITKPYESAISIIRLLVEAQGVVLESQKATTSLPGFLFDMNVFFQALVSRFLRENLSGYAVLDEKSLKGMMRYNVDFNPQQRKPPTPRPDFIVTKNGSPCAILDTKYRDLWEKQLPREMLYQLVVYAISNRQNPKGSIIYPTTDPVAREARIDISDPISGDHLGQVCLRPIYLARIENLVTSRTSQIRSESEQLAQYLAFGERKQGNIQ